MPGAASSAGAWAGALFHCPMFPARARATLRADGTALVEIAGVDMGQGAWTALAQIAADGLGLDIDSVEFRSGTSDLPDGGVAGGLGHTASAGAALSTGRLRCDCPARRTRHCRSQTRPLFGAGNAGVEGARRAGLPSRRRDAQRKLCRDSCPRRQGEHRGQWHRRARPKERRESAPCSRMARSLPRSRSTRIPRPGSCDQAGGRLRGGAHHQPAAGPEPALWRHDLGRLLCPARGGDPTTGVRAAS